MEVVLTSGELEHLRDRLLRFASADDPNLNRVVVSVRDGAVWWAATDSYRLARLPAGTAGGDGAFAVPVRTMVLAWQMCDRREADAATFSVDGERGVLSLPGIEVPFDPSTAGAPDIDSYLAGDPPEGGTEVTISAEDLLAAIHGANLHPQWLGDDEREHFALHVDAAAGRLRALAIWDGHPDTSATVACAASGDARVAVNPRFLFDLAEAAGEELLTLHLPPDASAPLRVETGDGFVALLMPCRMGVELARPGFESMLAGVLGVEPADIERDGDGDYPVALSDEHSMYLSLHDGDADRDVPDTVAVFAVLASGIKPSRALLAEINDLNRNVRFARVVWADGQVRVGDELLLSTLDPEDLDHACRTVASLAARVAPMLRLVHGGSGSAPAVDLR